MMQLFIQRINPVSWSFPYMGYWSLKDDIIPYVQDIRFVGVGTIDLRRDAGLGIEHEKEFRRLFPRLLAAIESSGAAHEATFVWAEGPMYPGGLPDVFPYILRDDQCGNRYHIAEVTATSTEGYHTSWISFEFCEASIVKLMDRLDIDLEQTKLSAMRLPQEYIAGAIVRRPQECVNPRNALKWNSLAVNSYSHFEGCYLAGPEAIIESVLTAIRLHMEGVSLQEVAYE